MFAMRLDANRTIVPAAVPPPSPAQRQAVRMAASQVAAMNLAADETEHRRHAGRSRGVDAGSGALAAEEVLFYLLAKPPKSLTCAPVSTIGPPSPRAGLPDSRFNK